MRTGEIVKLAKHLDSIGQHDLADRIDHLLFAETHPGTGLSMQLLPGEMTTMRGPAGAAILRDEQERGVADEEPVQVKERPRKKSVRRGPGVSIGENVMLDSRDEKPGPSRE